ncbi:MAG: 3-oxoacyl-ACP reductase FabG [Fibromonadaceae bacterium]|jgi:3-oxoacyl-[acyl-carrier protein] reductase|nr:3-oxoacyl-ACP reductase FabG [Fibromonadaceae bacterium]
MKVKSKKRVLVTGASGGIGKAIAENLAIGGYSVVAHYNNNYPSANALATAMCEKGYDVDLLQCDLRNRTQCRSAIENDIEQNGTYYGIVTSAGVCSDAAFPALTDEDWDKVIDTNLNGFFNIVHPAIMPMCRAKTGRIVAISSVAGIVGNRGQVNYSASKAGLIGAVKALAVELASRSITVNCVAPGLIETDMLKNVPMDVVLSTIPMQRIGKPHEVAAVVEFLLSESASYITRQVISVNGGLI